MKKLRSHPLLRRLVIGLGIILLWFIIVMVYQVNKPLPKGISIESPLFKVSDVTFWYDLTYPDGQGGTQYEQQIFDRTLAMVDEAEQFIVIDMFLFNDYVHKDQLAKYPDVSGMLTQALINKKKQQPAIDIVLITDEVNTNYGSAPNHLFESMKSAGIDVIITNVNPLRDSTPLYSAVWRTLFQWFGQSGEGTLPNAMASAAPDLTVRSYLKLLNVKANHRKVIVNEQSALISSSNIHNASAFHSNIAFEVRGSAIEPILQAEQAVVNFSDKGTLLPTLYAGSIPANESTKTEMNEGEIGNADDLLYTRYLTEGKILKYTLEGIRSADKGDTLWMGMFYLADSKVIDELVSAAKRGVSVRLLLDPNENAFGQEKIGLPNRPVAKQLMEQTDNNIVIRWYNTTEEQYHTKLMYVAKLKDRSIILGGSANLTSRNLRDYNLENNLWVSAPPNSRLTQQLDQYFDRLWNNQDATYSLDVSAYQENTVWFKDIIYHLQKWLGFTTY